MPSRDGLADFEWLHLLGRGSFGEVHQVRHYHTRQTFAMKCVAKEAMSERLEQEIDILRLLDCQYVTKMFQTYEDDRFCYLQLELASGGSLREIFHTHHLYGSIRHVKYYSAGATCAVQYLHERCVMHRDIKPENMLMNSMGQLKVADFGLSKQSWGRTYSVCGTDAYMAPEVIGGRGYTHAVDWWSLGITMHDLMGGTPCSVPTKRIRGQRFPEWLTEECIAMINSLCHDCCWKRGWKVRERSWFSNWQWDTFNDFPPFVPAP